MSEFLLFIPILTILILYISYKRWYNKNYFKIQTIKELRKLHKDAVLEDMNTSEEGIITTVTGTALYPSNGRIILFEFEFKWANRIFIESKQNDVLPYNKKSLHHEFTQPEKTNFWRKDQLEQHRK